MTLVCDYRVNVGYPNYLRTITDSLFQKSPDNAYFSFVLFGSRVLRILRCKKKIPLLIDISVYFTL